jgi:crooked neck
MRKLLGKGIGIAPTERLFRGYIELELQLREFDRARILYTKLLLFRPTVATHWIGMAEFEAMLGEDERCRALFELALKRTVDSQDSVWQSYTEFEVAAGRIEAAKALFERRIELDDRTGVWTEFANFEFNNGGVESGREMFLRAYQHFKDRGMQEERLAILESWQDFEGENGDAENTEKVRAMFPKQVRKRRQVLHPETDKLLFEEEFFELVFPDDAAASSGRRLLEAAQRWRDKQGQT